MFCILYAYLRSISVRDERIRLKPTKKKAGLADALYLSSRKGEGFTSTWENWVLVLGGDSLIPI